MTVLQRLECHIWQRRTRLGKVAKYWVKAVIHILESDKGIPNMSTSSDFIPPMSQTPNGYDSDIHSACRGDSTSSPN